MTNLKRFGTGFILPFTHRSGAPNDGHRSASCLNLVPRVFSVFKMAAGEDPGTQQCKTTADWCNSYTNSHWFVISKQIWPPFFAVISWNFSGDISGLRNLKWEQNSSLIIYKSVADPLEAETSKKKEIQVYFADYLCFVWSTAVFLLISATLQIFRVMNWQSLDVMWQIVCEIPNGNLIISIFLDKAIQGCHYF